MLTERPFHGIVLYERVGRGVHSKFSKIQYDMMIIIQYIAYTNFKYELRFN